LTPNRFADEQELVSRHVPHREPVHPVEAFGDPGSPLLAGVQHDFGVSAGAELVAER
jgi:hypothetical protein